jgi:rhamnogalacturonan endolyase
MMRSLAMKSIRLAVATVVVVSAAAVQAAPKCPSADLIRDDFSRFPPGWLSKPVGLLNGAIQEYHYLPNRGVPLDPWEAPIVHLDAWIAGDEDGVPYVEQHIVNELATIMSPLFVTGDEEWNDYTVEARVRPLNLNEIAGLVFRYRTNRHHYQFVLTGGKEARLRVRLPTEKDYRVAEYRELGKVAFKYDEKRWYTLRVENEGPAIRAYIDGKLVLQAQDQELLKGKAGLVANVPARFAAFRATTCQAGKDAIAVRIRKRGDELAKLRSEYPAPRLWRKFDTPKYGAGRNVRFGDLDGDGKLDMLIAQNIPRVQGDAFSHISALTAVNMQGEVLWQSGRPDPRNGLLTNDSPFQIQDMDNDGRNEVVMIRDFKLQVLDGRTGKVKKWTWMPATPANAKVKPYASYSGDSIAMANLTGGKGRRDLLLKDRYRHVWAYSHDLKPLWHVEEETGHFPYIIDVDGDGRDELFIGHGMYDHTGKRLWSHDGQFKDHVDAVAVGNFTDDPKAPPRVYWSSSDESFVMLDLAGKILKHERVGHTQTAGVGKFRPDLPGLQYFTVNFWRNPGITTLFDTDGKILAQSEPIHSGSLTLPVNWRGDGGELMLVSGSVKEGGLIDGHLRRVVMFPDDGHPELTAHVLDVTGDPRDEIFLWDQNSVWIYTQDGPTPKGKIYAPIRTPHYNDSNYRATVSLPRWKDLK